MDLGLGEQSSGRLRTWARLSAFGCFLVAAGILAASLLAPPRHYGTDGFSPHETGAIR